MKRQNRQGVGGQAVPAAVMGALAFALVFVITAAPGPGLDPDALQYMGAAQSVARHGSYRVPKAKWTSADSTEALAHFPPGYPTVLALPVRLGMAPAQGARLVQATAAFVTIATVLLLVSAAATPGAGIAVCLALLVMPSMHEVHVSVLSEPLYLACMMLVLAGMVWGPASPWRSGVPAAVGVMTRYAGASLVGAAALWQLMQRGSWLDRARRAVVALVPAVVLQGVWVVRTRLAAGPGEIRKVAFYGEGLRETFAQGFATLTAWIIPDVGAVADPIPHRGMLALAVGVLLAGLVVVAAWRTAAVARVAARRAGSFVGHSAVERADGRALFAWRVLAASFLLLVCYLGIVLASRVFADPEIPLDERILAPALLLLMVIVAVGVGRWFAGTRLRVARVAIGVGMVAWFAGSAAVTLNDARYALTWGSDFAGKQWKESELLAWVRGAGARGPVYTNWPALMYFYLGRPARELPLEDADSTALAAFADTVRVRGGKVVLFNVQTAEFVSMERLVQLPGLKEIVRMGDGIVLEAK